MSNTFWLVNGKTFSLSLFYCKSFSTIVGNILLRFYNLAKKNIEKVHWLSENIKQDGYFSPVADFFSTMFYFCKQKLNILLAVISK